MSQSDAVASFCGKSVRFAGDLYFDCIRSFSLEIERSQLHNALAMTMDFTALFQFVDKRKGELIMKKMVIVLSLMITGLFCTSSSLAGETAHWGYSGSDGPENWGELAPEFSACSKGKNQSPVNLAAMIKGDLPPISINYEVGGNEILNNGHTVQVNYQPGSTITADGRQFELKQFHFHSPSENTIEGSFFPMEAHFVHADRQGNLLVVAVMFKEGERNAELEKAWVHMPVNLNEKKGNAATCGCQRPATA